MTKDNKLVERLRALSPLKPWTDATIREACVLALQAAAALEAADTIQTRGGDVERVKTAFWASLSNANAVRRWLDHDSMDEIIVAAWEGFEEPVRQALTAPPQSVSGMREALELLVRYARWQISEGRAYHPTLPSAVSKAEAALTASPPTPQVAGRVEVSADHPLAKALRPSKECIDEIERMENASNAAAAQLRNVPLGSSAPQVDAGEVLRVLEPFVTELAGYSEPDEWADDDELADMPAVIRIGHLRAARSLADKLGGEG